MELLEHGFQDQLPKDWCGPGPCLARPPQTPSEKTCQQHGTRLVQGPFGTVRPSPEHPQTRNSNFLIKGVDCNLYPAPPFKGSIFTSRAPTNHIRERRTMHAERLCLPPGLGFPVHSGTEWTQALAKKRTEQKRGRG